MNRNSKTLRFPLLTAVLLGSLSVPAGASAPAGRYTLSAGTVLDNQTRLTWQQAPVTVYTWANAQTYCSTLSLNGSGWRLPSLKELLTIVDDTVDTVASPGPTIDATAFPNTPAGSFWTSSPLAGNSSFAWVVGFGAGNTYFNDVSETNDVRCVR